MSNILEFPRGDDIYHEFLMPASAWSAGGHLFFSAKPVIDDDLTDAAAVIKRTFDDTVVSDTTIKGVAYKLYTCHFPPSDTIGIDSNGAESLDYLGDFQWVSSTGIVTTFPPVDPKIDVQVTFDVTRDVTP